jgi:hypothetical protein
MQPAAPEVSTCPNCGGVLEKIPGGELGCFSCLLRAGIGSEEETVHDPTPALSTTACALVSIKSIVMLMEVFMRLVAERWV